LDALEIAKGCNPHDRISWATDELLLASAVRLVKPSLRADLRIRQPGAIA